MRCSLVFLALIAVSALVPFASARIVETLTFADVKAAGQERLTLFHFSTDAKSAELVSMLEEAATQLQALRLPALERFSFAEVDCVKPQNAGECSAAGFAAGKEWLFTSTQASGIQAYTGARTASAVATHVHHKFLPADPALVQSWKDEESFFRALDGPRATPIFLKLWESWCTHCKALKQPFEQMAAYFSPQVTFMELECSRSELSKAFCARHGATSFPTLMLFDGEDLKQKYDGERTIVGVEEFFLSKLTEEQFTTVGAAPKADSAPAKKTKSKQAKADKKKAAEKTTDTETAAAAPAAAAAAKKSAEPTKAAKAKKQAVEEEDEEEEEEEEEEAPKKKKKKQQQKKKKKKAAKKQPKQKKKTKQQIEDEEDEQPIEDEDDEDDEPPRKSQKASAKKKKQKKQPKKKAQRKQVDEDEEDEDEEEEEAPKKKQNKKKKKQPAQKKKKQKKRAPVEEEEEEEEEEPAPKAKAKAKQPKKKQAAAKKAASTAGMTQAERRKAKRAAQAAAAAAAEQEADEHLHDEL